MGKRKRTWRWTATAVTAVCLLTGIPGSAAADDDINLTVRAGFDGSYKAGTWTVMQVTLENKGPDFQGDVEIVEKASTTQPNSGHYGTYRKPVVLPKGTTKQVLIEVPAGYLEQPLTVRLVDAAGKVEAKHSPGITSPMDNQLLIGAISAKESDLAFLTKTAGPGIGDRVHVRELDGTNLPEKADLLRSLDVLAINHAPQEKLTPEQIAAVKAWVEGGGNLLLAGGAQYAGGAGLFADLSPVTAGGTVEVRDLSGLEKLAGQKPNLNQLTVTGATLKPGAQALAEAGDLPLIAWQPVGAGKVFYAGYDLSVEPLASWTGNAELWKRVLTERATGTVQKETVNPGYQLTNLARTAGSFPNLVPPMRILALAFGAYVLIAGPGLYLFLRRKNRGEWAWALIPATSIVFAAGIFGFGALERGSGPVTQTLAHIQLKSADAADVQAAAAFVIPSGGNYSVEAKADGRIAPLNPNYSYNEQGLQAQVVQEGAKLSVVYESVEYFTSREADVSATVSGLGLVTADLTLDDAGRIKGTLVNDSKLDLERLHLIAGASSFEVGDLKAGESKTIDATFHYTAPSSNMAMHQTLRDKLVGSSYMQYGPAFDIEEERRRTLVDFGLQPYKLGQADVALIGFSKSPLDLYTIDGAAVQAETRSLVTQDLTLKHGTGLVKWPLGMVRPKLINAEGNVSINQIELILQGGSIDLEYDLQLAPGFVAAKAQIDLDESMYALLKKRYFNWKTQRWEDVNGKLLTDLSAADLQKYMSPDGIMRVQLQGDSQLASGPFLHFPSMGVEGKVSP
ncbi:putative membrane protein [Tumebacillus sp. BK434]|uniref:DUF7408 domain-containing protein n=1 Tax=Tumebacillus sp. BK434 TaxID=2512169 RepID=UPI00104BDB1E|nr:hypothetical protein [Tumebacillus sp. BK434]TCP59035.1 putative membrane protein [Tumebacillus sp. BK434]